MTSPPLSPAQDFFSLTQNPAPVRSDAASVAPKNDFISLTDSQAPKALGTFGTAKRLYQNFGRMFDENSGDVFASIAVQKAAQKGKGPDHAAILLEDFNNMFTKVKAQGFGKVVGEAWEGVKEAGVLGVADQLGAGILNLTIGNAFELSLGGRIDDEGNAIALTPEDSARRSKELAGFIASIGVEALATKGVSSMLGAQRTIRGVSSVDDVIAGAGAGLFTDRALLTARPIMGEFARKVVAGSAGGVVGGGVGAAIAGANTEDILPNIFIESIMFAPIGTAMEVSGQFGSTTIDRITGKKNVVGMPEMISKQARDIGLMRQIQATNDVTLHDVVQRVGILETADDLTDIVVKDFTGSLELSGTIEPTKTVILADLTAEEMANIKQKVIAQAKVAQDNITKSRIVKAEMAGGRPRELTPINTADPEIKKFLDESQLADLTHHGYKLKFADVIDSIIYNDDHLALAYLSPSFATNLDLLDPTRSSLVGQTQHAIRKIIADKNLPDWSKATDPADIIEIEIPKLKYQNNNAARNIIAAEAELAQPVNFEEYGLVFYDSVADKFDVILKQTSISGDPSEARSNFRDTGFIPNELVTYEGKRYVVNTHGAPGSPDIRYKTGEPRPIFLTSLETGKRLTVKREDVRRLQMQGMDAEKVLMDSPFTLKGLYIKEQTENFKYGAKGFIVEANERAMKLAKTGQPITFIGVRQQRGSGAISKTGRFYAANPQHTGVGYDADPKATRRTEAGAINSLVIHRLAFENPYVVDAAQGAHYEMLKMIRSGTTGLRITAKQEAQFIEANNVTHSSKKGKGYGGGLTGTNSGATTYESGYQLQDLVLAEVMRQNGHDGIIYNKTEPASYGGNEVVWGEIVDLRQGAIADIKAQVEVNLPVVTKEKFLRRMFDDFLTRTKQTAEDATELNKTEALSSARDKERKLRQEEGVWQDEIFAEEVQNYAKKHNVDLTGIKSGPGEAQAKYRINRKLDELDQAYEDKIIDALSAIAKDKYGNDYFKLTDADQKAARVTAGDPLTSRGFSKTEVKFDEVKMTDLPFAQEVAKFAESRGFLPQEIPSLAANFERQFHEKILNTVLEPDEKLLYEKFAKESTELLDNESKKIVESLEPASDRLARSASSNRMYLEVAEAGNITVRDLESGKRLHTTPFKNVREAQEFINKTGQAFGPDLMGNNGGVPPGIGGDIMGDGRYERGPFEVPYEFSPLSTVEKKFAAMNAMSGKFTSLREQLIQMDNVWGTKLFAQIYEPTQVAHRKVTAALAPYRDKIHEVDKILRKMNVEDRVTITEYIETRSPEEIAAQFTKGRGLTDNEKRLGQNWADTQVDVTKLFKRRRALLDHAEEFPDPTQLKAQEALAQIEQEFSLTPDEQVAFGQMGEVLKLPVGEISLLGITRYARAITNKEMTGSQFAASRKMNSEQLRAAGMIKKIYDEAAVEFGFSDTRQLMGYVAHYKMYETNLDSKALFHKMMSKPQMPDAQEKFVSDMIRTGEIDIYEKDPLKSLERYVTAGFKTRDFYPTWNKAKKALEEQVTGNKKGLDGSDIKDENGKVIPNVTDQNARVGIQKRVDSYLGELRGYGDESVRFVESVVDQLHKNLGITVEKSFRDRAITRILMVNESAAQGFKMSAGIRDYTSFLQNYFIRFGQKRMITAQKFWGDIEVINHLERTGEIGTLTLEELSVPGAVPGKIATGMTAFMEASFKGSLQKDAYKFAHGAAYIETWTHTGQLLNRVAKGEIDKFKAYKEIKLDSYSLPVAEEFDRILRTGGADKIDQASRFLARNTGAETAGLYGAANHPEGWQTNFGRLAGQFGTWAVHQASMVRQNLTRGTKAEIGARMLRFAIAQGAFKVAGNALGYNFNKWMLTPGALMAPGGVMVGLYGAVRETTSGSEYERNKGLRTLKQLIPIYNGRASSIFVPGSFAAQGVADMFDLMDRNFNPLVAVTAAAGMPVDKKNRSSLDDMLGIRPRLDKK